MDRETRFDVLCGRLYANPCYGQLPAEAASQFEALFESSFPYLVRFDFGRFFSESRERGVSGPAFMVVQDWCSEHVRCGWHYLTGTRHGPGVVVFDDHSSAERFSLKFGGGVEQVGRTDLEASRRIRGAGRHMIPLGWRHSETPLSSFWEPVLYWCRSHVKRGAWDFTRTDAAPLDDGFRSQGRFIEMAAFFTDETEAEAFRSFVASSPICSRTPGASAVDLGFRTWPDRISAERTINAVFQDEADWAKAHCGRNSWQFMTSSETRQDEEGRRQYRTWLRLPNHSIADDFSSWLADRHTGISGGMRSP